MVLCKYFQQGYCRYGPSCRFEHAYSSKYSYISPQSTANQNNGFNQPTSGSNSSASSIFRSAVQNNNSNNQSVFGQSHPSRPSVFSRLGSQTNAFVSNENQKAKSLFAQASQNVYGQTNAQVLNTQNPFTSNAKAVFAQASHNTLNQVQNQNIMSHYQNNAANLFANAASSVFAQQNNSPFSNFSSNVFQISERPSNVFGRANNSFDQTLCDENLYSKLEDLSKSDIEAFECADFRLGCIPELPPPKSLCV